MGRKQKVASRVLARCLVASPQVRNLAVYL
jgi:hypothetical protein